MTHWSARLLADQLGSRSPRWLFGIITRQAIRRGTFTSVKDLIAGIEAFIDGCNERCHPFVWTKTADEILTEAHRKQTNNHATLEPETAQYEMHVAAYAALLADLKPRFIHHPSRSDLLSICSST